MHRRIALAAALGGLTALALAAPASEPLDAQVYELRVYHTHPGKLTHLHERFRNHTNHLFVKHGMRLIAYWTPADEDDQLIYVLAFQSAEARERAWDAFREDPEWKRVFAESREKAGGPIVEEVESTLMHPTDYSPIR